MAEKHGNQAVHPLHILIALAQEREGIMRPVSGKMRCAAAGSDCGIGAVAASSSESGGRPDWTSGGDDDLPFHQPGV